MRVFSYLLYTSLCVFTTIESKILAILYPNRLDSCNSEKSLLSVLSIMSLLFNTDSITTAGMDIMDFMQDKDIFEKLNKYTDRMPINKTFIDPECTDLVKLIDDFSSVLTKALSRKNEWSSVIDQVTELINNNFVLIDGEKLKLNYDKMIQKYYYQSTASPALIIVSECVEPRIEYTNEDELDMYEFINNHLTRLVDDRKMGFEACPTCINNLISKLVKTIGISREKDSEINEFVDSTIKDISNSHQSMLQYILDIKKENMPKSLGEVVKKILTLENLNKMNYNNSIINRIMPSMIAIMDEYNSELIGLSEPNISRAFDEYFIEQNCDKAV